MEGRRLLRYFGPRFVISSAARNLVTAIPAWLVEMLAYLHSSRLIHAMPFMLACMLLCPGCGKNTDSPRPASAPAPQASEATGYFEAVDLEGHPLANMRPIATREPNAFDEPVATGDPTGADGKGRLVFPNNERLFLRLWDPELKYFANNFFESVAHEGNVTDNLKVVMAPAASFAVTLLLADGTSLNQDPVEIMMSHPTRGPWWPARGTTDDAGHARFDRVPPGQYVLRVTTASGHEIEVPEIQLPPSAHLDLGALTLR